jgi:hypothetical protein
MSNPQLADVDHQLGLCKDVDENYCPLYETFDFTSDDLFIIIYFYKKLVSFDDHVSFFIFYLEECVYRLDLHIDREVPGQYIFAQLSIPYFLTLVESRKTLYPCTIGMAINNEPWGKIQFKIRNTELTYKRL